MKLIAFSLLLTISFHQVEPFALSIIAGIYSMYQIVNDAHDTYSKAATPNTEEVMDEVLRVKDSVNQVTKDVSNKIDSLYEELITQLPLLEQVNRGMETFSKLYNRISYLYKNFEHLIREKNPDGRALKEFMNEPLGFGDDSVGATLDALHELFIPTEIGHLNDGLLMIIAKNLKFQEQRAGEDICSIGSPPEEQIYSLYTALLTAEMRGFMMRGFTYLVLENISEETYADQIEDSRNGALLRMSEYIEEMGGLVQWSSRSYFNCDPPEGYERGVSFAEFELFMSSYVAFQRTIQGDCYGYCDDIADVNKAKGVNDCHFGDRICSSTTSCTGRVFNCIPLDESHNEACLNSGQNIGSRRYQYLLKGGHRYGSKGSCVSQNKLRLRSEMVYHSRTNRRHRCDYCMCTCLEDTSTSRHRHAVSFRPQLADFANNKVVAGIKFTKTEHMLHLQIQQGKIQFDNIGAESLEWIPLDTMEFVPSNDQYKAPTFQDKNGNEYKAGDDYQLLTYKEREFNLDELNVPDGYVVTGARLNRGTMDAIHLEIHATPYDFASAKVIISDDKPSIWIVEDDTMLPDDLKNVQYLPPDLMEMFQEKRSSADKAKTSHEVDFKKPTAVVAKSGLQINVGLSNLEGDIASTVYPLIDIREVTTPSLFLLQGIGLFYKRPVNDSEVGYLAFSLRSVSRKTFLDIEVTASHLNT